MATNPRTRPGPFSVDQLRAGDRYELHNGHAVYCAPTGGEGSAPISFGAAVIAFDPKVAYSGVDTGYTNADRELYAPDVSVMPHAPERGWMHGVPPLAIEYAGVGQDEEALRDKLIYLLSNGTRVIWVVRLTGPRRVEVHWAGEETVVVPAGGVLDSRGILSEPVRVDALFDREAAKVAVLGHLLREYGYRSLEDVEQQARAEGIAEGKAEGIAEGKAEGIAEGKAAGLAEGESEGAEALRGVILSILASRQLPRSEALAARVAAESSLATLAGWASRAAIVASADDIFAG